MTKKIKCPHCQNEIDVEEILVHNIETHYQAQFQLQQNALQAAFEEKESQLIKRKAALQEKEKGIEHRIKKEAEALCTAKEMEIKQAAKRELELELDDYRNRVGESELMLKNVREQLLQIKKAKRISDQEKEKMKLEFEERMEAYAMRIVNESKEIEAGKAELKLKEKDILIKQLSENVDDLKKKIEQGSQQLQGEAQEMQIESFLETQYPFDEIKEVPKGQKGSDAIQAVRNVMQKTAGLILYESKRTKKFSRDWIKKIKQDMQTCNADVAVIVSETLPDGWTKFGLIDGVWICAYSELSAVSLVLREMILKIADVEIAQENKGSKMQSLYDFLTSNEFTRLISGIVEGFTTMQIQLESEKRSLTAIWKKREKQIQAVTQNAVDMYGAIKAIAGAEIADIPRLELNQNLELE